MIFRTHSRLLCAAGAMMLPMRRPWRARATRALSGALVLLMCGGTVRRRPGRDDRLDDRCRQGQPGRGHSRRQRRGRPRTVGLDVRSRDAGRRTLRHAGHARRRSVQGERLAPRVLYGGAEQHHAEPRRHPGPRVLAEARGRQRRRHGRRGHRSGLQLHAHGRRHRGDARRSGDAADHFRAHHGHHPPDAAVRRHRHHRRPGQPREQHHGRRLVFQRHVRPGHDDRRPRATARASRRSRSRRSSRSR